MSDGESVEATLDRDIGIVGAVALGVGTMIAAGIFVLSGLAVSNVGAMAIVAFAAAAVVASFTAFAYAEFAAIYPESGGGYAYVSNTFDSDLTYIVGWSMILGYPASAAFYLASFSDWFDRFILPLVSSGLEEALPFWISGVVILALLLALNLKGTEESGQFQIVVTALKVALIIVFLYGGLQAFDSATIATSFAENADRYRQIGLTSALVFITFFGFEAIATNAEEIEEPARNVPRAIFISMGFVTVVYTLVVLVVTLAVNDPQYLRFLVERVPGLSGVPGAEEFVAENGELAMGYAASYYLGNVGFYVIIVGALFSMLSAANATVLAGSRVKLAMARRDHLPRRYEELHDRFNTPYFSVALTGGLILFFVLFFTVIFGQNATLEIAGFEFHTGIEAIAHFADFMLLTGLVVVNLAVVRSRRKFPDMDRGFEVPAVPWVPAVAIVANLVLLVNVEPGAFAFGVLAELVGVVVWFAVVGRADEEEIERETPTVVRETHPAERDYRILVPVANPENADQLMRTARDIAADRDGEILALSVVSLPDQTPLSEGYQYLDARREVLDRVMSFGDREPGAAGPATDGGSAVAATAEEPRVPVSGCIRIGHDVSHAIVNTVEQYDCDAVLMGWKGRPARRRDVVVGSTVDDVVREADADVLVERVGETGPVERILLPTAGGPHAEYAAEVARAIAHTTGATVEAMRILPTGADEERHEDARRGLGRTVEILNPEGEDREVDADTTVVENDDVVEAIVEASAGVDLTLVGATQEGFFERLVFGTIPEAVGRRAESTVIMAKRDLGVTSRLRNLR
jgi:amino acid transporter/nucleotide-binding universal stress UspA family protein